MTADPNIFAQFLRPAKSVADYAAEADEGETNKLKLALMRFGVQGEQQKATDARDTRNALQRIAFANQGKSQLEVARAYQGDPLTMDRGFAMEKEATNNAHVAAQTEQSLAAAGKSKVEAQIARHDQLLQKLVTVRDLPGATAWINESVRAGDLPFDQANLVLRKLQSGELPFATWREGALAGGVKIGDRFREDQQNARNAATNFTTQRGQDMSRQTQLQTNAATVGLGYSRLREDQRHNGVTEGGAAGLEGFTPAAIEAAAGRYNLDGTLPPMGMGKAGAEGRRAILNRAAELSAGKTGTEMRADQLDNKSSAGALAQITKSKTMASSFEQTANANADLALGLSNKLDRTGVPILNAGIQYLRTGSGSPEAAQFAAANETFVAEYAKIMSGGMGNGPVSDAARAKASKLLTTAMTQQQYAGNVKLLQNEMRNRMKGFDDEIAGLRSRLSGKPAASATPEAPAVPAASGWTVQKVN